MLGGSVAAAVGGESVGWSISVPTSHAAAATELLADVAQHPTFDAAVLETERVVALADLATLRDDMYRYPMRLAMTTAFAGHPYGVPSLGSEASLQSHGAEDLRRWHGDRFLSGSTVIGFVSDADPDALAETTANAAVSNNYLWRGLTQSENDPAVSGGIDYVADSGFYVGTWVSNVSYLDADPFSYEHDIYFGYSGGDSFTDLYGARRLSAVMMPKTRSLPVSGRSSS